MCSFGPIRHVKYNKLYLRQEETRLLSAQFLPHLDSLNNFIELWSLQKEIFSSIYQTHEQSDITDVYNCLKSKPVIKLHRRQLVARGASKQQSVILKISNKK